MTRQQRAILIALLDGPLTTGQCWERLKIPTLSQRAGELERLGLVVRGRAKVGDGAPVCLAFLTEEGRRVAEALARGVPEPTGDGAPVVVPPQSVSPSPVVRQAGSLFAEGPVKHDRG